MKKIIYFTLLVLLASCSLKETAHNVTNPYEFYRNGVQIRSALNACYNPLSDFHNLAYMIAVEGASDLAFTQYSAQKDAKLDISPSSAGCGNNVWEQCYKGIRYCLSTRAGIERSPLGEDEKTPYLAEAVILESYYWYILTSFFGDVPFYEDYIETEADLDRIGHIGRMSAAVTRQTMIEELEEMIPALPQIRSSEVKDNYCGAAMGWMLIAKMAAWDKAWDKVIEACSNLEDIYGELGQYDWNDCWFSNKNTAESIFEIQHTWSEGGLNKTSNVACVCMPYPHTAGTNIYNKVDVEYIGTTATVYRPLAPTAYFKSSVLTETSGDLRRDATIATSWNGVAFSQAWLGPKFWCPGMYGTRDSNNYKIFRYADAVLLLAEAYSETGEYEKAITYLNKVKSRAGISLYGTFDTYVKLREEIRKERGRELFGEFGRKYDLVRWGIWYSQVLAYNTYDNVQMNIRPCHEYYPIPDSEVLASDGALNNDEYAKYGISE